MKRNFLLTFLVTMIGLLTFDASALTMRILVDKANNVTVAANYGFNDPYTLESGVTESFEVDPLDVNPIMITANPGATITSVQLNGTDVIASEEGKTYQVRIPYSGNAFIQITTDGEGTAPKPVAKSINFNVYGIGEGFTVQGTPYSVSYKDDEDKWQPAPAGQYGMKFSAPENATIKITPDTGYEIVELRLQGAEEAMEVTKESDGSITFVNNLDDYAVLNLTLKEAEGFISFSVTVDYPDNIVAYLEHQRSEEGPGYKRLELKNGVNKFICEAAANPLEFMAVEGGKILQVTRNGQDAPAIGWGGMNGYVYEVETGDEFVVSTKGPEIGVLVKGMNANSATLDAYYFTRNDGSVIKLEGSEATLTANQGEYIYVSARPGTKYEMLMGQNGAVTSSDWKSWFQMTPGTNGPAEIRIDGTRNIVGVDIDVDAAARVSIVQEGGRGDALTLSNGVNNFALADLKNALAISSTDGNQITSVTYNGDIVAPNANGVYLVTVADKSYVQVKSRKNPVETKINFNMLNEGTELKWVSVKVNGYAVATEPTITAQTYSTISIAAKPGYTLRTVNCDKSEVTLTYDMLTDTYNYYLSSADVTEVTFDIVAIENQAADGYAIVVPNGNEMLIRYWEVEYIANEDRYALVKVLENNTVNEVKLGNYVQIYRKDGLTFYSSVTVNGVAMSEKDIEPRAIYIKIDGRTEIEASCYAPTEVYTLPCYDDVRHVQSGTIQFEVDGEKFERFYAEPGMTAKLIPLPNPGYVFDHYELFYPLTIDSDGIKLEGDSYTFTEEDCTHEFLCIKGFFKVDENKPVYVVRGNNAWLLDDNGEVNPSATSAMGTVMMELPDGKSREYTGFEGDVVKLTIEVTDPEYVTLYEVANFCLMSGFPNNIIPTNYTINPADADTDGVIWVCGLMRKKGQGIDGIATESLAYNAETGILTAPAAVKVFDINGQLVIEAAAGEVSTETLAGGLYIAISGNKTLKFVK